MRVRFGPRVRIRDSLSPSSSTPLSFRESEEKMSSSQRMRKSSPCSKQGPMRATLPVSSLMRQGRQSSSLRKSNSNSPTVSPTNAAVWRARISPETSSSSGQRSPGSLSYKGTITPLPTPSLPLLPLPFFRGLVLCARGVLLEEHVFARVTPRAPKSLSRTNICPSDDDFGARRDYRYCHLSFERHVIPGDSGPVEKYVNPGVLCANLIFVKQAFFFIGRHFLRYRCPRYVT